MISLRTAQKRRLSMLERYSVRPTTIDRIRASWIAGAHRAVCRVAHRAQVRPSECVSPRPAPGALRGLCRELHDVLARARWRSAPRLMGLNSVSGFCRKTAGCVGDRPTTRTEVLRLHRDFGQQVLDATERYERRDLLIAPLDYPNCGRMGYSRQGSPLTWMAWSAGTPEKGDRLPRSASM